MTKFLRHSLFDKLSLLAILVFTLVALTSCRRIPLYSPESDVYLKLKIYFKTKAEIVEPEQVRVCFYDYESHKKINEVLLPLEGGFVDIPAGVYDVIAYTMANQVTKVDGIDTRATLRAYTRETGVIMKVTKSDGNGTDNVTVFQEPDDLYTGKLEGVVIPVHSPDEKTLVIEMELESIVETWHLEVRNVKGLQNIASMQAYVTGLTPAKYAWDYRKLNRDSAISFPVQKDQDRSYLTATFNIFGRCPSPGVESWLNLIATDTAGNQYLWVFKVTDQFDNPDNTEHLIIIDDEAMAIPDNPGDVGGFSPIVDEWGTVIIPINV